MKNNLLKNIFSLAVVQGGNYIIPLITLPYLVKTLGPYSYGLLGFSLALIQYFSIFINYGFNLSATHKIALVAGDKNEVSNVFWNVITCQVLLFIVSILSISISIAVSDYLKQHAIILFSATGILLGNVLFPVWLFQGKEKMALSSFVNITSRLMAIPLIFVYVNTTNDEWIAALIMSATGIVGGGLSIFIIIREKWITWHRINFSEVYKQFVDGWYLFLSTAAISIYTSSITVLLGIICGPLAVGYFVAADKLRIAAQGLITPISQACYPRVVAIISRNKKEGLIFIRKLFLFQLSLGMMISVSIFFLSPFIIGLLYGERYTSSISTLKILSICPLLISISNVLGIQTMTVLGYKKQFFFILLVAGAVCIAALYPLAVNFYENGAALSVLLSEMLVTILMLSFVYRKRIFS